MPRAPASSQIQAASAARLMADSINEVYIEGKGATKVALVNLPSNTQSVTFSSNEVIISLETRSGTTQITYPFFGNVSDATLETKIEDRRGLMPVTFSVGEDQERAAEHERGRQQDAVVMAIEEPDGVGHHQADEPDDPGRRDRGRGEQRGRDKDATLGASHVRPEVERRLLAQR